MVEPQRAEEVREYVKSVEGTELTLESGEKVTLLKGDVREKNNEAILIYRYQLKI